MLDWLERLFCPHNWALERTDGINVYEKNDSKRPFKYVMVKIYECRRCRNLKTVKTEIKH